jgi:hypothetical protein
MEGRARDPRLASVQRSYAPTRLSDDTLMGVYDRLVHVRLIVEDVSETRAVDRPVSASPLLVLTGGQHA